MNKLIISIEILSLFLFYSCLDDYYFESDKKIIPKLVVDANLNDFDSLQTILLSKSVSPDTAIFEPVMNAMLVVSSEDGNIYQFIENPSKPGCYNCVMTKKDFKPDINYSLYIRTQDGVEYNSLFEQYIPCPEIDSVKYELTALPTAENDFYVDGLQFYVDLDAGLSSCHFYRYTIDETWEYHSTWPIQEYIDVNNIYHEGPTDYSKYVCYKTERIKRIYLLSTDNLATNSYENFKLHFVDNYTQRLLYRYSILLKQYTLTESAYQFWNSLAENQQESGGLFDTQPMNIKGNMKCLTDSTIKVLGFFSLSSVSAKRISVIDVPDLSFNVTYCKGVEIFGPIPDIPRPFYLIKVENSTGALVRGMANPWCFDCTLLGGSTEIPSFWKE